ncbi:MAG TPA: hypothetical protein VGB48_02580 [Allosphingosinicella sp.]
MLQILAFVSGPAEQMFEPITAKAAVERLAACGLPGASIRYDEDLQQEVLAVTVSARVSDEKLACADQAVSFYELELPTDLQQRYQKLRDDRLTAFDEQRAERWLAERGLLHKLPLKAPARSADAALVRAIERVCGRRAKGALRAESGFLTLNMRWLERRFEPGFRNEETMTCLLHAATVTGASIGFFGNEAVWAPE